MTAFEELGSVDGRSVYFANYCTVEDWTDCFQEVGLFEQIPSEGNVSLIAFIENIDPPNEIDRPQLISNPAGTILYVPVRMSGTGAFNESEHFLYSRGKWDRLESESWVTGLGRYLPAGRQVWKGIWPDFRTLTAETGLWVDGDGNCCPTGGTARIRLEIKGLRYVIKSVEIDRQNLRQ